MTEKDERDEEAVSAESAELIRAHAELKKMVRTGEDLLYWNHTSGQRPLTRDERKERREARRGDDETPTRMLERALERPLSGVWLRVRSAKVAVGAAVVTILVGGMVAYLSPSPRLPVATTPAATPVDVAERRAPPAPRTASAIGTAPPASTAPSAMAAPSLVESASTARLSALPERVPNVLPRRTVQAPRRAHPPSASRPDLPGSVAPAVPEASPTAAPPADRDSVANPDYDLLVPEIRRP
jgi:hypothetical protein